MPARRLRDTALFQVLEERRAGELVGTLLRLESSVEDLLAYVTVAFPHYTRHTLPHSIEIVDQVGKVLLAHDGTWVPGTEMTSAEIYLLACAALLHDAGMVTPEPEQAKILRSAEWSDWVDRGRTAELDDIRSRLSDDTADDGERFVANVALRRMIADFVRRAHHERSASLVLGESPLPDLSLGDRRVTRVVAELCRSHGLPRQDLSDDVRFPCHTDLLGDPVDVRFVAILLRLGDLLDMSHDRGCPLTAWAVGGVDANSAAHWSQYDSISHQASSPTAIEVRAEASTEDEYRLLRDWCTWICDEIAGIHSLLARSARHATWRPPESTMETLRPTIRVEPAEDADFVPSEWRLDVDPALVVDRFAASVHQDPRRGTLIELLQNALDATRCAAVEASRAEDGTPETNPTRLPRELRQDFPISITLAERTDPETAETRQELIVEDRGIGMSPSDVTEYLLQVGRSFYATRSFRERYGFSPVSQFGVGFLTVFRLGTSVTVETRNETVGEAVHFTVTHPSSYVVRRPSSQQAPGTRVTIRLAEPIPQGFVSTHLLRSATFVEFPLVIDDLGQRITMFDEERSREIPTFVEAELKPDAATIVGVRVDEDEASGWVTIPTYRQRGVVKLGRPLGLSRHEEEDGHTPLASAIQRADRHPREDILEPRTVVALSGITNTSLGRETGGGFPVGVRLDIRPQHRIEELTLDRRVGGARALIEGPEVRAFDRLLADLLERWPALRDGRRWLGARQQLFNTFPGAEGLRHLPVVPVRVGRRRRVLSLVDLAGGPIGVAWHNRLAIGDAWQVARDHVDGLPPGDGDDHQWEEHETNEMFLARMLTGAERGGSAPEIGHPDAPAPVPTISLADVLQMPIEVWRALQEGRHVQAAERSGEWWTFLADVGPTHRPPRRRTHVPPRSYTLGEAVHLVAIVAPRIPEPRMADILPDRRNLSSGDDVNPIGLNLANPLGAWLSTALVERPDHDQTTRLIVQHLHRLLHNAMFVDREDPDDGLNLVSFTRALDELRSGSVVIDGIPPPPGGRLSRTEEDGLVFRG